MLLCHHISKGTAHKVMIYNILMSYYNLWYIRHLIRNSSNYSIPIIPPTTPEELGYLPMGLLSMELTIQINRIIDVNRALKTKTRQSW